MTQVDHGSISPDNKGSFPLLKLGHTITNGVVLIKKGDDGVVFFVIGRDATAIQEPSFEFIFTDHFSDASERLKSMSPVVDSDLTGRFSNGTHSRKVLRMGLQKRLAMRVRIWPLRLPQAGG